MYGTPILSLTPCQTSFVILLKNIAYASIIVDMEVGGRVDI